MQLIPAIDIIDGKCVRLEKGNFAEKKIYDVSPLEVAKSYESLGIKRLHIVDLDGAAGNGKSNFKVLEQIAGETNLVIDYGGGLKSTHAVRSVFNAGASLASVGTVIVRDPDLFKEWILLFGAENFLPGADVLDMYIKIHGWTEETGVHVFDFIRNLMRQGVRQVFCTDISKDGMLQGPSYKLYQEIMSAFPDLALVASGGISSYDDLRELHKIGCAGAIIGKALYEEKITVEEISYFLKDH
jgi:phosphoribosylformimino-5-aminoimidazole carboxamide ribotide isomerase